ncbi:succinate dehydrogenase, cytochrome b556 subunit [Amylibacter sp. IMCC11727]|uniref:succinate dehydrogenase, cytochrome b556 subunit n=1 Tax=Amylibacter sp. IMCC11727 TaxID=3039851 RepID=UPI00244E2D86|nr:succinate dehydrogenase, cytochrome b556 subunit [Amylibacter sp. IMCC11727]WGI23135.1 succinate dehydrogenase, cytochrome b556 subunit [Amylibacter sp. IMCC11727]
MADVNRGNRPLSPHLSIYRMAITMLVSIMNRITGAGMALAAILIVWWLMAAASGADYYATVNGFLTSWFGLLILVGSLWALWFHFLGGLRHLFMDFGLGYEIKTVNMTGWIVLIGSFVLTALSLICIV